MSGECTTGQTAVSAGDESRCHIDESHEVMTSTKYVPARHCREKRYNLMSREDLVQRIEALEAQNEALRKRVTGTNSEAPAKKKKKQREFDFSKFNTRHVALQIAYLGWDYSGVYRPDFIYKKARICLHRVF